VILSFCIVVAPFLVGVRQKSAIIEPGKVDVADFVLAGSKIKPHLEAAQSVCDDEAASILAGKKYSTIAELAASLIRAFFSPKFGYLLLVNYPDF
jgi:hypothetical protein